MCEENVEIERGLSSLYSCIVANMLWDIPNYIVTWGNNDEMFRRSLLSSLCRLHLNMLQLVLANMLHTLVVSCACEVPVIALQK